MTDRAELSEMVDALIDDARKAMWHDAQIDTEAWRYARRLANQKFRNTLRRFRRKRRAHAPSAGEEK